MGNLGDNHRPLRDVVCDDLRERIVRGHYPPGTHLVEDRLANDLGVSRNPVREGLRVLESEGLVRVVPRRGAVVATPSDEDVREIFEVRMPLEQLAARLAARRRDDSHIAAFEGILERSTEALKQRDAAELTALNSAFHEQVLEAAANTYLQSIMQRMRSRMKWIFSQTAAGARGQDSVDEHHQMYMAIKEQNGEEAAAVASLHVAAAETSYWQGRPSD